MPEYRAHVDAVIQFANGGSLSTEGFRLDLPSADASADDISRLLVQHLGLTLVGSVTLSNLEIVEEQHRGSRGIETAPAQSAAPSRRVVDLSHVIRAGLVTYPGLPAPTITPHLTRQDSRAKYAPGTEFAMDIITMIGNTGTYLDSPWHRYGDGADLAGLDLGTLVDLRAEVFHVTDIASRGVPASVFWDRDVTDAAVLIHTGWDRHFGTPAYASGSPYLDTAAVEYLVGQGAALVGIDALNIDDTESGGERPAHSGLLAAGIHVVEHLTNLGALPARGARFTAAPPAVEGFGTFPVRAFAIVE
ncbi:cyclase family protein [Antiquaquibacter soli]|uniref:Cyclase family protein n=1 Tax=Antiquaquibacter soli TaxID=3064523 RepID=A0ABT9BMF3_9MICO|nr:cyclase family protein [Protaetiibacter sp. WY-16]MDO7880961.1 cyclase family protein [Protaetiibacter sp. WY-16]